jgi:hypothetical protein
MNRHIPLLLSCIIFAIAIPASAAIRVEKIVAGLDGFVRGERWAPVTIDLENTGDDFIGTFQVLKGETVFQKSLHLSSGSKKHLELIYYHSNYY